MEQQPYPHDPAYQPDPSAPPAYGYGQQPVFHPSTQYSPQYSPQYPPAYRVAPKNPAVSLLVSFFVPGVGSMINGDVGKGVVILVGYIISVFLVIVLVGLLGMLGFWIWGMVDAYTGAQKWNLRHGIVS